MRTLSIVAIAAMLQACASSATRLPRPATSSLGCMQAAIAPLDEAIDSDTRAHCMAAGLIALHCSRTEAWLASIGKEIADLFGSGRAEMRDLHADRDGIRCARHAAGREELTECCRAAETPADE